MAAFRGLRRFLGISKPVPEPVPEPEPEPELKPEPEILTIEAVINPNITIGRHTYGAIESIMYAFDDAPVSVGNFCSIARGVVIMGSGNHSPSTVTTFPLFLAYKSAGEYRNASRGPTMIGNDVWIGENAIVLSGVKVGHGAIIGAATVVTKDVPPYAVVVGNPGRIIKYRFPPPVIAGLLRIEWWNWSDERIEAQIESMEGDAAEFVRRHAM